MKRKYIAIPITAAVANVPTIDQFSPRSAGPMLVLGKSDGGLTGV
jgi:hypothetical protein